MSDVARTFDVRWLTTRELPLGCFKTTQYPAKAQKAEAGVPKVVEEVAEETAGPGEEWTEAERDNGIEKELTNWKKSVALVREAFWEGRQAEEAMW